MLPKIELKNIDKNDPSNKAASKKLPIVEEMYKESYEDLPDEDVSIT